jgi:hypothetical protein
LTFAIGAFVQSTEVNMFYPQGNIPSQGNFGYPHELTCSPKVAASLYQSTIAA